MMQPNHTIGPYGKAAYGMAMGSLGLASVIGYAIFLRTIWGRRELQKRSIFLMSLCVSDLVMISGHMITTIMATFHKTWPYGDMGCQINAFFGMAPSLVSLANIALIAYDAYNRECKKDQHGTNYGFFITMAWVTGFVAGFLPVLGMGAFAFESPLKVGCLLDFSDPRNGIASYLSLLTVCWFLFPMYYIVKYYGKLYKETGNGYLLRVIPVQVMCAWTPYALCSILMLLVGPANVPQVAFAMASNLCAKISIATNPYIYISSDPKLKAACQEMLMGSDSDETNKDK
ncbi:rhodopsin-like [Styela clava]